MSGLPPEALIWNFLRGAMMTKALGIAADLRIPDQLGDGARPVEEVARDVGADADSLHRILRALASDGIFAEDGPGVFRNTEASNLVRGDGWDDFAHLFGGTFYRAVADLDEAVRAGSPTFAPAFGTDFWSWLADNAGERASFDRAMAGGKHRSVDRLAAIDWREGDTVVDVGGGNGALLVELLRTRRELRGIVFDLPETVRDEAALGERIEFVAGSFFDRVPAGDVYVLSGILHDWDDERAAAILRAIRESAAPHARLLVLDAVVPPGNDPRGAKWLDLLMLVLSGGRERTEVEWRRLLDKAGFAVDQIEDGLIQARCR